jgi:hypothetical protein
MLSRRAALLAGSAVLAPLAGRSQGASPSSDLLADLMRRHHVPGVSVATIRDGGIAERLATTPHLRLSHRSGTSVPGFAVFAAAGQDAFKPASRP